MGLKILGRVGRRHTYIYFFFTYLFFWEKRNFMHFEVLPNYIFFPDNLKIFLGFTSKFRYGRVTLNTAVFYLASTELEDTPGLMNMKINAI